MNYETVINAIESYNAKNLGCRLDDDHPLMMSVYLHVNDDKLLYRINCRIRDVNDHYQMFGIDTAIRALHYGVSNSKFRQMLIGTDFNKGEAEDNHFWAMTAAVQRKDPYKIELRRLMEQDHNMAHAILDKGTSVLLTIFQRAFADHDTKQDTIGMLYHAAITDDVDGVVQRLQVIQAIIDRIKNERLDIFIHLVLLVYLTNKASIAQMIANCVGIDCIDVVEGLSYGMNMKAFHRLSRKTDPAALRKRIIHAMNAAMDRDDVYSFIRLYRVNHCTYPEVVVTKQLFIDLLRVLKTPFA